MMMSLHLQLKSRLRKLCPDCHPHSDHVTSPPVPVDPDELERQEADTVELFLDQGVWVPDGQWSFLFLTIHSRARHQCQNDLLRVDKGAVGLGGDESAQCKQCDGETL